MRKKRNIDGEGDWDGPLNCEVGVSQIDKTKKKFTMKETSWYITPYSMHVTYIIYWREINQLKNTKPRPMYSLWQAGYIY